MKHDQFDTCLKIVLKHEGGFVNHPRDPGGATAFGITIGTYSDWIGKQATVQDMKRLSIADVAPIYRKNYWDRIGCDDLPAGVDLMLFDFGVNAGTKRAVKYLQRLIGTSVDGVIGPYTLAKLNDYIELHGRDEVLYQYAEIRKRYYAKLRTFDVFGQGWFNRVRSVLNSSKLMPK